MNDFSLVVRLLVLLLFGVLSRGSLIVTLDKPGEQCFQTQLPDKPTIVSGNYEVLTDDGEDLVRAVLVDKAAPTGKNLWESSQYLDSFSLTVDAGVRLKFCFIKSSEPQEEAREYEYPEQVEVGFHLRVHPIPRSLPSEEDGPDTERAMKITEAAVSIENEWSNLMDHFEFLRSRESVHQKLTNEILGRIMGWSLVESAAVVLMAVCQVMYWKKFFEQRRYL